MNQNLNIFEIRFRLPDQILISRFLTLQEGREVNEAGFLFGGQVNNAVFDGTMVCRGWYAVT
jgi:hypothetical protein